MSKRSPQPMFNPGELDRTRRNLGNLSREESKRMAVLLGGEVGIEKDDSDLSEKYARLRAQSRRRTDIPGISSGKPQAASFRGETALLEPADETSAENASAFRAVSPRRERKPPPRPSDRPPYWARVRMNFLAAGRDHKVMTLGSAISTLLPSGDRNDRINPAFLPEVEKHLLPLLTTVKQGSLSLLKGGNRRGSLHRPDPFYRRILEILSDWPVDSVQGELKRLPLQGRQLTISQCAPLCRALYRPLVRLLALTPLPGRRGEDDPLESAVRHYYKLNHLLNSQEAQKKYKQTALDVLNSLPLLFQRLHYGYYPLLLKLSSTSFFRHDEFFLDHKSEYLPFLGLQEEDLLPCPGTLPPVSPEEFSDLPGQAVTEKPEEPKKISGSFTEGLRLLQDMFPQAGFEDLSTGPDLLPYFKTHIPFPKNFDLINPADPLQSIVVIMGILRELFFAFGGIKMGTLKNDEWDVEDLRQTFESYTLQWFRYLEDFIPKQLLEPLLEHCREVEKGSAEKSEYAQKLEMNYIRLKKMLYLPHLEIPKSNQPRPPVGERQPKLFNLTDDMVNLLSNMIREQSAGGEPRAILNGQDPIQFEVQSLVSRRFLLTLKRREITPDNSILIRYTTALAEVLNEFLNNPASFYYRAPLTPVYRTLKSGGTTPQYNVPPLETEKLLKELDKRYGKDQILAREEERLSEENLLTGISEALEQLQAEKIDWSLMLMKPTGDLCESPLEQLLRQTLREEDHWYHREKSGFGILLRNTSAEGSVYLANRIQKQLKASQPACYYSVGITPLQEEWSPEEAMARGEKTLSQSQKREGGVIILYDARRSRYRIFAPSRDDEPREKEGVPHESLS